MKVSFYHIILFVILVLSGSNYCAQNFKEDYKKMSNALKEHSFYKLKIDYFLYKDGDLSTPYQKKHSVLSVDQNNAHYRQEDVEILSNEKFNITISDVNKQIYITDAENDEIPANPFNELYTNVDDMFRQIQKTDYVKKSDIEAIYDMAFKEGKYSSIRIIFNPVSFLVSKAEYVFREPQLLPEDNKKHKLTFHVHYVSYDLVTKPDGKLFDENKIFKTSANGQLIPVGKYIKYKILY